MAGHNVVDNGLLGPRHTISLSDVKEPFSLPPPPATELLKLRVVHYPWVPRLGKWKNNIICLRGDFFARSDRENVTGERKQKEGEYRLKNTNQQTKEDERAM